MMRVIPVLFCVLIGIASAGVVLPAGVLFAAPPEEKLPELSKPKLHREETALEKAVNRAAAMLLQGKLPASEDGVRFALWLHGDKGDVAYLDIATKMARELVKIDPIMGTAALYWVAQAGGPTLEEARANENKANRHASNDFVWIAGVAAKREQTAWGGRAAIVYDPERGQKSMVALTTHLRVLTEFGQFFAGRYEEPQTAKELLERFWDAKKGQFLDADGSNQLIHHDNAQTALMVWGTGFLFQDAGLREVGLKAIEKDLETALQDSNATAIAGLAAARLSRHPVQIAIIGDPRDSKITALRQAAYFLFEPNKVILNLDPKTDAARMAKLMYPPEAAPAMFVCVETLCSPPIKDPAELEKEVAEIKKLAAEVQQ